MYLLFQLQKKIQNLIGKEIVDELIFITIIKRKTFLSNKVGSEIAELYEIVSIKMIEKTTEYYKKISYINNPFEKENLYEKIDYTEIFQILNNYSKKSKI